MSHSSCEHAKVADYWQATYEASPVGRHVYIATALSPQNQKWDEEETIGIGPKRIDEARRIDEATRTNCFYRYATLFKYGILRSNRDVEDDICRLHLQQGSMKTRCVCTINTFDGYTNEIHQNTTRILAATMC